MLKCCDPGPRQPFDFFHKESTMTATAARRATTQTNLGMEHEESDRPNAASAETSAAGGGRDGKGRFRAGNTGGPGNLFTRQTAQLRAALIQRVTIDDINVIADELILQARNGKLASIKLLFQYIIGKPTVAVNPDTLDVEEFQQIYAPRKEINECAAEITQGLPPRTLNVMVRETNEACGEQMAKILSLPPEEFAEARKNLAAFFPGAQATRVADPDAQFADEVAAVLQDLDTDEESEEEECEEAPSTKRGNGAAAANGNGRRPSRKGNDGGGAAAAGSGSPPSTNGNSARRSDGGDGGRRRCG